MKTRLMIFGSLIASACAWVGCTQSKVTRPGQQASGITFPGSTPEVETPKPNIVVTSYTSSDDATARPRVTLRRQMVIFMDQPDVDVALKELWGDATSASSTDTSERVARSRVVASEEISAKLKSLAEQHLAGIRPEIATIISSGKAVPWKDEMQRNYDWQVTPTVKSAGMLHLSVAGQAAEGASGTKTGNIRTVAIASELRPGETLVVEGPERQVIGLNVATVPILGDIPIVGPLLFSKITESPTENRKTLCLITAEIVAEPEAGIEPD